MIPVFIGWDSRETVAWHVLAHSLIECTRRYTLALTPIGNNVLPKSVWWRERGPYDATEFSNARFLVPFLMDFDGWAIFMDGDMLATADLGYLWEQRRDEYAVILRKHDYRPTAEKKFLGERQTVYPRKNWSSLMLLNCGHPATRELTCRYVNSAPGLDLHGFAWCPDAAIGELKGPWNTLIKHDDPRELELVNRPALIHFTEGGPWHGYVGQPYGRAWTRALIDMLTANNPSAQPIPNLAEGAGPNDLRIGVTYTLAR